MNTVRQTRKSTFSPIFIIVTSFLLLATPGFAQDQKEQAPPSSVEQKLKDFERRLQELEERQKERQKDGELSEMTVQLDELRQQLAVITEEVERLRSGEQEEPPPPVSQRGAAGIGLGEAAASVYKKTSGVSIAGYGEMLYQNTDSQNESGVSVPSLSELDFLRAILYFGYRFDDKFVFNSEIEIEHADEISVEFAYVDYLANPAFNLRGGMVLVPMGMVNELHEPNVFLGARRTETESHIIPSTWRENGFGFFGSKGIFDYRAYLVNGLDGSGFSSSGLRGGRQKGAKAKAFDMAFVGRVDVNPTPGVQIGGAVYYGNSGQNLQGTGGETLDVRTTVAEIHGQARLRGFDVRGLYAFSNVDQAGELSAALGLPTTSPVAERMRGGYLQFGYNLLNRVSDRVQLIPYYRFEDVNTQVRVPLGYRADPRQHRTLHTFGFELKPIYQIVIKTDYQWISNRAETGVNQFNIALGYVF